ncbi:MAG: hypothetical protein IJG87_03825 [Ruminococcus sp.]|nr:hypothetical protein [Ruminococcus sp.]
MKIIRELSDMIEDEIDGALDYARKAVELKGEHKKLADALYELSTEEVSHISRLHDEVVRLIDKYKAEKGEPPADMMAIYDYLHKKHIAKVAEIKRYQEMYKTM